MSDTDDRDETHAKAPFKPGDQVRVSTRFPVGYCAVPHYVRGKRGRVEAVIAPAAAIPAAAINGQEEPGESTRPKLCHYHIAIPLAELWPEYAGIAVDGLHAEVIETWLEKDLTCTDPQRRQPSKRGHQAHPRAGRNSSWQSSPRRSWTRVIGRLRRA
jgi:hypothetical protein